MDTRKDAHEKLVIVDGNILWFGSLNPLSHTSRTGEVMARMVNGQLAQQMAAFVAIKPSKQTATYSNLAMVKGPMHFLAPKGPEVLDETARWIDLQITGRCADGGLYFFKLEIHLKLREAMCKYTLPAFNPVGGN